jgi:hypothetical protein
VLPDGFGHDPRTERQRAESGAWQDAFDGSVFEPLQHAELEHRQRFSRADVVSYFASISPIASLPETERRARLESFAAQLDRDEYERLFRVDVYWTRLTE